MDKKSIWIPIAKITDAVPRHGLALDVGEEPVALFFIDGSYYATSNVCTHQFALLTQGYVDGDCVDCPMHQGQFHIPTGEPRGGPVTKALRTYPVRVEGDDVLIQFTPSVSA